MCPLSIPDEPAAPPARAHRWGDVAAWVGVPLAVAIIFIATLVGEQGGAGLDLQLITENVAAPGRGFALRAFLLDYDEQGRRTPRLESRPVDVSLRTEDGDVVARAVLEPSALPGMEGVLQVPSDLSGRYVVDARVRDGERYLAAVVKPITVAPDATGREPVGRLATPLTRYTPYPVHAVDGEVAPSRLDARVLGGACVPEQRCDVLVWVGEPGAALRVEEGGGVEPLDRTRIAPDPDAVSDAGGGPPDAGPSPAGAEPAETDGLVSIPLVVHGPEAVLRLQASRGGRLVARRQVRLAVDLGGVCLEPADGGSGFRAAALDLGRGVIVDAFHEGRWERTGSVSADRLDGPLELPFEPLEPGLWRLQVRADAFSSNGAATRLVVVGEGPHEAALRAAAGAAWATELPPAPASVPGTPAERAAFTLAAAELDVVPQPNAVSGRIQRRAVDEDAEGRRRLVAGGAILLGGLLLTILFLRRGLVAAAQARRIMADAGDLDALGPRKRWSATLSVLAVVALVLLAFLATGLMLLSRGMW